MVVVGRALGTERPGADYRGLGGEGSFWLQHHRKKTMERWRSALQLLFHSVL